MTAGISERETQEHLKRLTVLFVEDGRVSCELRSVFLSRFVGVLVTAINGAEGLDAWRQHKPDIIITDIQMPVMDGLAMLQEIRSVDRAVPVIILSAFEEPEYLKRCIDLGVYGYVVNDTFGHPVGDLVLKELSLLLKTMVRVDDALYQAKNEGRNRVVAACDVVLS